MKIAMPLAAAGAVLAVSLSGVESSAPAFAAAAVTLPAPAGAVAEKGDTAVAVFAGGCFWGVEGVFERVAGVRKAESGYAGGNGGDANYGAVSAGRTRHAEAVRITYDPRKVSYNQLLHIFFAVAHDPTQLNRQGPDVGRQYRSAIFPQNAQQQRAAATYIQQLGRPGGVRGRVVTKLEQGRFHAAEEHHQNFMRKNPGHGYIVAHDLPKLMALRSSFPRLYSGKPSA